MWTTYCYGTLATGLAFGAPIAAGSQAATRYGAQPTLVVSGDAVGLAVFVAVAGP
ncbi:MAG TPA: hypothetical protein VGL02_11120 [Streptomyces sp.]